ncbi:MAG TPA: UDP-3-O-(3-hydroxymyristoyl)glucosamine N-acyltransferase [Candidatus Limnocylindrales bacterium]|nr:UDP-3-O-(3-hydroxymyristoyl)glucosamine N-acyltransferase [Candidatus Limnocylindrales bacterium]
MRLAELAARLQLVFEGDADIEITGLAPIDEAGPGDLTFVGNPRYRLQLATTRAAAVIVAHGEDAHGHAALRADNPYGAFIAALPLFDARPRAHGGIHPTAVLAASAEIGANASIGAYAVIGDGVRIGSDAVIHPHVVIYAGACIGDRFTAHAGTVVRENVIIGSDVVLQPGAVVGGDGFGFLPRGKDVPLPIAQIGTVELADHVEIGANATVDRATVGATRLGRGVKIDNLVMVGHGSRIGEGSMLAGQCGMAGSTRIGARVMAGGQAGFAGHLSVGDDARIGAQAGVIADIDAGVTVAGMPAQEIGRWRRAMAALRGLPELVRRIRRLEHAVGLRTPNPAPDPAADA